MRIERDAALNSKVSDDPEFAALWVKGRGDFNTLEEASQIRLMFFNRSVIMHWHNMFLLHQKKLLQEEDWSEMVWLIENLAGTRQDLRAAWSMFRNSFGASFQTFMDTEIAVAEKLAANTNPT